MRARILLAVVSMAALGCGCGSAEEPILTCGPGTQNVGGQCESVITCGEGTFNFNNTCQPDTGLTVCGDGTEEVEGQCVPSDAACAEGTRLVGGVCVPTSVVVCGPGTQLNEDDECEPIEVLICGPGTVARPLEDDAADTASQICELLCTDGEIWDQLGEACVDQCQPGTRYDEVTHTCAPLCSDTEYYVGALNDCVEVPECLVNTELVGNDCVGWPFDEISLDTLCARRAFAICDAIFDPACGCDHGGEVNLAELFEAIDLLLQVEGEDDIPAEQEIVREAVFPSLEAFFSADRAACLSREIHFCEGRGVALARALEAAGQATVNVDGETNALADFDAHFARRPGECTRPVDWDPWPTELVEALVTGGVARGEPCLHEWACDDADRCWLEDPLPPGQNPLDRELVDLTCQERAGLNDGCQIEQGISRLFVPLDPNACAKGLTCRPAPGDERLLCRAPGDTDDLCFTDAECEEGLVCRPINPLEPESSEGNPRACREPLAVTLPCPLPGRLDYLTRDLCGPDLYCNDVVFGVLSDGEGRCSNAGVEGDSCAYLIDPDADDTKRGWCLEVAGVAGGFLETLGYASPHVRDPFSYCGDALNCTLERSGDGYSQVCAGEISVCPQIWTEVIWPGGICTENVCDDTTTIGEAEVPVDNDHDGSPNCADADCFDAPNCFESICDDGDDEDGDEAIDCRDVDCCAVAGGHVGAVACTPDGTPTGPPESCFCDDLDDEGIPIDNDGDGSANCADDDCYGIAGCPTPG